MIPLPRSRFLIAASVALALALAPAAADARAGGGGSFGSRGSMTYTPPPLTRTNPLGAAPMQRSLTPRPAPNYSAPSYGMPGYGRGYGYGGHPFFSGLLGGLFGAGLAGLLFGHGMFWGVSGFGGFLGLLLQIFLIVVVVRWLFRRMVGQPVFAGAGGLFRHSEQGAMAAGGGSGSGPAIAITEADFQQFEQILQAVQAAWSAHDLATLRTLATPEMVGYFAEQLAEQASRGVRNVVRDVRLLQGDLAQAWSEDSREYATVAMRFAMVDVTYDAAGRVVDGHPDEHTEATEVWTFMRAPGGRWLLSAIQQAR
jgi:predicted lipid-binding transport protein (Tim44 family)